MVAAEKGPQRILIANVPHAAGEKQQNVLAAQFFVDNRALENAIPSGRVTRLRHRDGRVTHLVCTRRFLV